MTTATPAFTFGVYSTIAERILSTFPDRTSAESWATQYRRDHPGEPWHTVFVVPI